MDKRVALFAVIVVCLGLLVYLTVSAPPQHLGVPPLPETPSGKQPSMDGGEQDSEDIKAPDFTLQSLEGESYSLSELRGKAVLISFWSPTCPPCVLQLPGLQKLYQAMPDESFEILAVTPANKAMVENTKKKHNLGFPVLLDTRGQVERLYRISSHPMAYVVGPRGMVRQAVPGAYNWSHESVLAYLKDLAQHKP